MTERPPKRLSAEDCLAKAAECAALAEKSLVEDHKIALKRMAESWRSLASDIAKRKKR